MDRVKVSELRRWLRKQGCTFTDIEHIVARQHGGSDDPANLALACQRCNRLKGSSLSAIDAQTDEVVRLFHPRNDSWPDHFASRGILIEGLTPTGRATVQLLAFNELRRLDLRAELPS